MTAIIIKLSVSSVGSWALLRTIGTVFLDYRLIFQYPQSDRGHCYQSQISHPYWIKSAFSILSRIVGTATQAAPALAFGNALCFQYPQSDRGHCYYPVQPEGVQLVDFQYPQSDRGHCYQYRLICTVFLSKTFSILSRIVGTATTCQPQGPEVEKFFQYPQSDRGHCYSQVAREEPDYVGLLVSSVGSWALLLKQIPDVPAQQPHFQYPQSDRGHCYWRRCLVIVRPPSPFSILSRIVGTATPEFTTPEIPTPFFQYPQSDRGHCYRGRSRHRLGLGRPFSILSRIVGTATNLQALDRPAHPDFQYPQSDRGHCYQAVTSFVTANIESFSILSRIVGTATRL